MSHLRALRKTSHMHWLTLSFDPNLEREYQAFFLPRFLQYIRFALIMAFVIYSGFGVLDYYLAPQHYKLMWLMRFGLGAPTLFLCAIFTYLKWFQKILQPALAFTSFVTSAVLVALVAVAPQPVDSTYYAGFMLVIFYSYTFVRLRAIYAAATGWSILVLYTFVATTIQPQEMWILINNISFLLAANIVGMIACYFIERQSRNNFLYLRRIEEETHRVDTVNQQLAKEISQRVKNEEQIRQSEEALRTIFDAVDAALFIHRPDGSVESVNRRMLEMYQTNLGDVLQSTPRSAPAPPSGNQLDRLEEIYSRVRNGENLRFEWKGLKQRDQEEFDVEVSLKKIVIAGSVKLLATVHDISERRRAEELRADMERMSRHDLKGPLNAIISLPELLREELHGLSEDQDMLLKRIEDAGYRMLDMVNLSLNMYKMEHGSYVLTPEPLDLAQVTRKVMEEAEAAFLGKDVCMKLFVDSEQENLDKIIPISGEELLLYAMLSNLIKNAMEASPAGSDVTICLDQEEDAVRISVSNPGEVPFAIREEFFDKYATSGKTDGTGLGTYSVRLIAQVHGGIVKLNTHDTGRTTVVVVLPRSAG